MEDANPGYAVARLTTQLRGTARRLQKAVHWPDAKATTVPDLAGDIINLFRQLQHYAPAADELRRKAVAEGAANQESASRTKMMLDDALKATRGGRRREPVREAGSDDRH